MSGNNIPSNSEPRIIQVIAAVASAYGGPSIGSVELNKALRSLGSNAVLITTTLNAGGAALTRDDITKLAGHGADIRAYAASFPRRLKHSWGLTRAIFSQAGTADLIHIHGQYLLPNIAAYAIAKLRRLPYGIQPHGGLEPYQRGKSARVKRLYGRIVGDRMIEGARYILFASQSEADRAADVVAPGQVTIASLGASLPAAVEVEETARWLKDTSRDRVVVFLGRLAKKKRPDLLLRAWRDISVRVPDARLVLAGPDDDYKREDLLLLAADLGVSASISLPGSLDAGQKAWILRRGGVFVLPSENENFGITVAEAMLAGAHCIVTREVAAHSHLVAAESGQVLDNVDDLAGSVTDALLDVESTTASGHRAEAYAQRSLSWRPLAEAILNRAVGG